MKRFFSLFLVLVFIFMLSSCSDKSTGKSVTYSIGNSPATLDPQFASDTAAQVVINNTFEGLVRLDKDGKVIPGIAEEWSISADGLTYAFKLKEGTEWYCPAVLKKEYGDEFYEKFSTAKVTAEDFVFACRRAITLREGTTHAHRLFVIENAPQVYSGALPVEKLGVSAPDANTLVIKLNAPCSDFLERLTECEFMPCNADFFEAMGGRYGISNKHIMCNGPFYITAWDPETSITAKANKFYAGEQTVVPSSVIFTFDDDPGSVASKVSSAALLAGILPPDIEMPEDTHFVKENRNGIFGFCFNCSDELLRNVNLRLALCCSIDRNIFSPVNDNTKPQFGFIPESCSVGSESYAQAAKGQTPIISYSEAMASGFFNASLEELEKSKVNLTVICPEWLETQVRQQLQVWQRVLGINIGLVVNAMPVEEINKALSAGEYQIALAGIASEYETAVDYVKSFRNGGFFRFDTAEYGVIVDKLMNTENETELVEGCFTAENFILQQGICFPVYSRASSFIVSDEADEIYMPGGPSTVTFIAAKRFD
ncbi:MAG: peptide ABC transporter substrate-binding protein [Clostridia bacterium]|nr:peptide ABC transporter substrate-binding protein [Clostridia bacterium]